MRIVLPLAFFCLFLASCSTLPVYGPAVKGPEARFIVKASDLDSGRVVHHMTGTAYYSEGYNEGESAMFGELGYAASREKNGFGWVVGTTFNGGQYNVMAVERQSGNKSFFGTSLSTEIYLDIAENRDSRFRLGLRTTGMYEWGQYRDFRIAADGIPLVRTSMKQPLTYNVSGTLEVEWRVQNTRIGPYTAFGYTFQNKDELAGFVASAGLFLRTSRFGFYSQINLQTSRMSTLNGGFILPLRF